jgi:hypothetical protein
MAKKVRPSVIRSDAQRVEVYNEGLCVYLHDAGHTDRLRSMLTSGQYGAANPDEDFFSNLSDPAFGAAVAADGLAAAYELQQDDPVVTEVAVGGPLTDAELAVARWWPPQRAFLDLPTGQLRVDTPNTMPLDPDEQDNEGAIVTVPPGRYVLMLYRIDEDAMRREEVKKYRGPEEFVLLVPDGQAGPVDGGSPILSYPEPPEDLSWVGAYAIDGKTFTCQVNFWDYWEWVRVNLDATAAQQLGLHCGSVLRLRAAKMTIDGVFLGDWEKEEYLLRYGKDRLDQQVAGRREAAIGGWQAFGDNTVLSVFRFKAARGVPEKYHETWIPATGEVLAEDLSPPEAPVLPPARFQGGVIHASVALAADKTVIVNVERRQLKAIGAKEGEVLKLTLAGGTHTLAIGTHDAEHEYAFLGPTAGSFLLQILHKRGTRCFAAKGAVPRRPAGMAIEVLPAGERSPLFGCFKPEPFDALSSFLRLRPMPASADSSKFDWAAPPAVGMAVELRRGTPSKRLPRWRRASCRHGRRTAPRHAVASAEKALSRMVVLKAWSGTA